MCFVHVTEGYPWEDKNGMMKSESEDLPAQVYVKPRVIGCYIISPDTLQVQVRAYNVSYSLLPSVRGFVFA